MAASVVDVTTETFQREVLDASKSTPVVVDFWAPWCGPCRVLKPILEKVAAEYGGRFKLAKVNSDENQELAAAYGVRSIPDVMAFRDGQPVSHFLGAIPESQVRVFIDSLIPSASEIERARGGAARAGGCGRSGLGAAQGAGARCRQSACPARPGRTADRAEAAGRSREDARRRSIAYRLGPACRDPARSRRLRPVSGLGRRRRPQKEARRGLRRPRSAPCPGEPACRVEALPRGARRAARNRAPGPELEGRRSPQAHPRHLQPRRRPAGPGLRVPQETRQRIVLSVARPAGKLQARRPADAESTACRRHWAGDRPHMRLKARLNAASDSYPISCATVATLAEPLASMRAAICMRHRVMYCIGG